MSTSQVERVLRWSVPVDDRAHEIGGGQILHVDCRPPDLTTPAGIVEIWTLEETDENLNTTAPKRQVQVFGTGHPLPTSHGAFLGSALDLGGRLVWHAFEVLP